MDNSRLNSIRLDIRGYLFLGIYFIYLIVQLLSTLNTSFGVPKAINYVIVSLFVSLFLLKKYNSKVVINNIVLLGLVGIVALQTNNETFFITSYLIIVASSFVDFKKIMWLHAITLSIFMLVTFLLYKIGILNEINYTTFQRGDTIRYTMGYTYTSFMPNFFFHLTLIYIYLRTRINLIEVGVILALNQYIYIYTDTKSAYYLTVIVVILSYLYIRFNLSNYISKKIIKFTYFVTMLYFVIVPTWLSYIYDPNIEWHYELNRFLTSRISLGSTAIERYGLPLFGEDVEWIVLEKAWLLRDYFYVDSSSLNMYVSFGIIFSLIVYILFYKVTSRQIVEGKNPVFFVLMLILLIHSSFDPQFFEIRYNPFILLIGLLINPRGEN